MSYAPHVHTPYGMIGEHLGLIVENRLNLELIFTAEDLESLVQEDMHRLLGDLAYGPTLSIHGPFQDLSPAAVDPGSKELTRRRFFQVFGLAEVLNPKVIVIHSGYEKWKFDHDVDLWLKLSVPLWEVLIREAERLGTVIAVENIFEDEPANLIRLMDELGSEHFKVCFDPGHFNVFSSVPLEDWLGPLGPHIRELHLHDNNGTMDAHLPVGEGSFDFKALFGALNGRDDIIQTIEAQNPEAVMKSMRALAEFQ